MSWILTHSGQHFDFSDPQPDMIRVQDIAHGLANECRFSGQCRSYYSVAQHSVLASRIVPPEYALEALLHDAAEAYCKDIPRPLKALLPDYRLIESRVEAAIRAHFGLPAQLSAEINRADLVLLATERRDLMPADATEWPELAGINPLPEKIIGMYAYGALALFSQRYKELGSTN